jgi:hypothetical protein
LNYSRLGKYFEQDLFSKPHIGVIQSNQWLSSPEMVLDLDLKKISISELKCIQSKCNFKIQKKNQEDLIMNGISIWFDVYFNQYVLSTSPEEMETHWKQTVILLPSLEGYTVEEKEEIPIQFTFQQDILNFRIYTLSIEFGE